MNLSRRSLITAAATAAAAQAQRNRVPNWKPKLGVLGNFSDANLAFVKAEGFTSMELNLDPRRLDDAAIDSIKDKVRTAGIYVSSLNLGGNHIDPDPAKRATQNQYAMQMI
jgi:sugar phosphate isomerase/epimerase